jgi:hypothetical protein
VLLPLFPHGAIYLDHDVRAHLGTQGAAGALGFWIDELGRPIALDVKVIGHVYQVLRTHQGAQLAPLAPILFDNDMTHRFNLLGC